MGTRGREGIALGKAGLQRGPRGRPKRPKRKEREVEKPGAGQLSTPDPHPRPYPGAALAPSFPVPGRTGRSKEKNELWGKTKTTFLGSSAFMKVKNALHPLPT